MKQLNHLSRLINSFDLFSTPQISRHFTTLINRVDPNHTCGGFTTELLIELIKSAKLLVSVADQYSVFAEDLRHAARNELQRRLKTTYSTNNAINLLDLYNMCKQLAVDQLMIAINTHVKKIGDNVFDCCEITTAEINELINNAQQLLKSFVCFDSSESSTHYAKLIVKHMCITYDYQTLNESRTRNYINKMIPDLLKYNCQ